MPIAPKLDVLAAHTVAQTMSVHVSMRGLTWNICVRKRSYIAILVAGGAAVQQIGKLFRQGSPSDLVSSVC